MVIHAESLVAVHAQPASVATSTDMRPPADPIASPPRFSVNTHAAAAWFTGTPCAPIITIADRAAGTGFGATSLLTGPA